MTHPQTAPTNERPSPLLQFWGHVGADSAYVRIQGSRLEWSLVGRQWVIEMAPITSIIAVTAEPGDDSSSLVVTTVVGSVEFVLPLETAEEAASLLVRLVAEAAEQSLHATVSPVVDGGGQVDQLINLRWMFDAAVVDEFDCDEEPARLVGS
jgi:hypothetical protein